jgi:transcriptional regulator with XRE-family HTH domain
MSSHIKNRRLNRLPDAMRHDLVETRKEHGWSQAELGRRVGLPQVHISAIETGKVVPRYNTLLDLVRVLGYDLLMVPRSLVPAVQSLIRDYRQPGRVADEESERPLYATDDEREGGLNES